MVCSFSGEIIDRHSVIELCGLGTGAKLSSILRVSKAPTPKEDSLFRDSGGMAVKLKRGMQLAPLPWARAILNRGLARSISQVLLAHPAELNSMGGGEHSSELKPRLPQSLPFGSLTMQLS